MLFFLATSSLNVLLPVFIVISNFMAASYLMYSKVSLELSSMLVRLCSVKLTATNRSCMDTPKTLSIASPLWTSSVASRIHSFFQKLSLKIMHMLYKIRHVLIKYTSTLFDKMHHMPLNIPNVRSMHMHVEFSKKFQLYFFRESLSLCPLNGANIHRRYGYEILPTSA